MKDKNSIKGTFIKEIKEFILTFNIITTNKNKIAIAPT
jgi:hypothetical protein